MEVILQRRKRSGPRVIQAIYLAALSHSGFALNNSLGQAVSAIAAELGSSESDAVAEQVPQELKVGVTELMKLIDRYPGGMGYLDDLCKRVTAAIVAYSESPERDSIH